MSKPLEKQPEVSSRNISSLQDALALGQFEQIYVQKAGFDLGKLYKTLKSVLSNEYAHTIFPLCRHYNSHAKKEYSFADTASSNDRERFKDILELIDYLHVTYKINKSINKNVSVFSDIFVVNNESMEFYKELCVQGIDPLTEEGANEVEDFFWNYNVHCSTSKKKTIKIK